MRRTLTIAATALAAALMLVPAATQASGSDNRASAADRNADRIPDRWERRHHLSLKVKQTRRDQDRDGLNNLGEFRSKTNPRDRDSDNDGIRDGAERRFGLSPRDDDSDDDGRDDGDENAGRVASFENGVLTIALASGGTVSGRVVNGVTEIECHGTATAQASHDDGDDDGRGDNSGPGNAEDDHGDDEDEDEDEDDNCSSANLTLNTIVHEAELKIRDGGAVFDEVELVK
jgi:hypothetical protein